MKFVFVLSYILTFGFTATAHPTDQTNYLQIPQMSSIKIIRDINILPKQSSIWLSSGESRVSCKIDLLWHTSNDDRILKAGTTFTILEVDSVLGFFGIFRLQYNNQNYDMHCDSFRTGQNRFRMSVGELKEAISNYAELQIAPPKDF